MIYTIYYTSWNPINFFRHVSQLNASMKVFNSTNSNVANPKQILSIKVVSFREIEIKFYSQNALKPGREANALWLFSHDLAENQGFGIYLTPNRKLFKSA